MPARNLPHARVEIVLGALLYLMTAYRRTQCPRVAACVAQHLDCLARHPHADPQIREMCAEMHEEWACTARPGLPRTNLH